MHVLVWHLLPGSLYSMKVPFTYQSSLVYPLPPPSTLKGLLANALQRYEDRGPLEALHEVEEAVRAVGAIPLAPVVLREHITSTVVNLKGHGKATDALARQFAFSPRLGAAVASHSEAFISRLAAALSRAALYLGDSESLVTCDDIRVEVIEPQHASAGTAIRVRTYVPVPLLTGYESERDIYWVQTECWQPQALRPYLFPLQRHGRWFEPAAISGRLTDPVEVVETSTFGPLLLTPAPPQSPKRRRRRGSRREEENHGRT